MLGAVLGAIGFQFHDSAGLLALTVLGLVILAVSLARWVAFRTRSYAQLEDTLAERSRRLETELENRKLIEDSLRKERSFFRQVIDICPNFIFAKDREGRFTLVNEAVAEAYGTSVAGLLGKTDADFNPDEAEVAHFRRYDIHVMESKEELNLEEEITDSKGQKRVLHTVKRPIIGESGMADHILGVSNDITQRKSYELELTAHREHLEQLVEERTKELLESQEQLRRSERLALLGSLAAAVAHEINNPVGAMMLIAENALQASEECTDNEDIRSVLARTSRRVIMHAKRCGAVVKGLLQFSRDSRSEKSPQSINELVEAAVELINESIDLRNTILRVELADSLPDVLVNPLAIEQVVVNLVKNALQSRDAGVHVVVSTMAGGDGVVVQVQDNGSGIAQEEMPHLFDPFYTTRSQSGGTGLGLSIVQRAIAEHGGSIDIDSTPGIGTKIRCFIPFSSLAVQGAASERSYEKSVS